MAIHGPNSWHAETRKPKPRGVKKPTGFAAMPADKLREISRAGGKKTHAIGKRRTFNSQTARDAVLIAHELGRVHKFTPEEARAAGLKGKRMLELYKHAAEILNNPEATAVQKAFAQQILDTKPVKKKTPPAHVPPTRERIRQSRNAGSSFGGYGHEHDFPDGDQPDEEE